MYLRNSCGKAGGCTDTPDCTSSVSNYPWSYSVSWCLVEYYRNRPMPASAVCGFLCKRLHDTLRLICLSNLHLCLMPTIYICIVYVYSVILQRQIAGWTPAFDVLMLLPDLSDLTWYMLQSMPRLSVKQNWNTGFSGWTEIRWHRRLHHSSLCSFLCVCAARLCACVRDLPAPQTHTGLAVDFLATRFTAIVYTSQILKYNGLAIVAFWYDCSTNVDHDKEAVVGYCVVCTVDHGTSAASVPFYVAATQVSHSRSCIIGT